MTLVSRILTLKCTLKPEGSTRTTGYEINKKVLSFVPIKTQVYYTSWKQKFNLTKSFQVTFDRQMVFALVVYKITFLVCIVSERSLRKRVACAPCFEVVFKVWTSVSFQRALSSLKYSSKCWQSLQNDNILDWYNDLLGVI